VDADAEGHLAVIAILFKQGPANALLDTLWKNVPEQKGKAVDIAIAIHVKDLLPADLGYFTFPGSLTAPPCSEGVTWYVLNNQGTLSADQVADFAKHYPMNARLLQPGEWARFSNQNSQTRLALRRAERRDDPASPVSVSCCCSMGELTKKWHGVCAVKQPGLKEFSPIC
jgi:hypothetical protein